MSSVGWFALLAVPACFWWMKRRKAAAPVLPSVTELSQLTPGRHRVRGVVQATEEVTKSVIDGADCVFLDHAEYRSINRLALGTDPMLREVARSTFATPFYLDDGTGKILVNPAQVTLEATTQRQDMYIEKRIRVGEELELTADFIRGRDSDELNPYRVLSRWDIDTQGEPPVLSYRTLPNMITVVDDTRAILSGVSLMVLVSGLVLAILVGF